MQHRNMARAPSFGVAETAVKVFRCEHQGCEKTFSRKSNLKAHTRLHTGEMPYRCPDCDKRFKWKSCLASHQRVHTRRVPEQPGASQETSPTSSRSRAKPSMSSSPTRSDAAVQLRYDAPPVKKKTLTMAATLGAAAAAATASDRTTSTSSPIAPPRTAPEHTAIAKVGAASPNTTATADPTMSPASQSYLTSIGQTGAPPSTVDHSEGTSAHAWSTNGYAEQTGAFAMHKPSSRHPIHADPGRLMREAGVHVADRPPNKKAQDALQQFLKEQQRLGAEHSHAAAALAVGAVLVAERQRSSAPSAESEQAPNHQQVLGPGSQRNNDLLQEQTEQQALYRCTVPAGVANQQGHAFADDTPPKYERYARRPEPDLNDVRYAMAAATAMHKRFQANGGPPPEAIGPVSGNAPFASAADVYRRKPETDDGDDLPALPRRGAARGDGRTTQPFETNEPVLDARGTQAAATPDRARVTDQAAYVTLDSATGAQKRHRSRSDREDELRAETSGRVPTNPAARAQFARHGQLEQQHHGDQARADGGVELEAFEYNRLMRLQMQKRQEEHAVSERERFLEEQQALLRKVETERLMELQRLRRQISQTKRARDGEDVVMRDLENGVGVARGDAAADTPEKPGANLDMDTELGQLDEKPPSIEPLSSRDARPLPGDDDDGNTGDDNYDDDADTEKANAGAARLADASNGVIDANAGSSAEDLDAAAMRPEAPELPEGFEFCQGLPTAHSASTGSGSGRDSLLGLNGLLDRSSAGSLRFSGEFGGQMHYFSQTTERRHSGQSYGGGPDTSDGLQRYYTREHSAALPRWSGNSGPRWSGNLSDSISAGGSGRSGRNSFSGGLIIPELALGARGSFSGGMSPLALGFLTPVVSPRPAGFAHEYVASPRLDSGSMAVDSYGPPA